MATGQDAIDFAKKLIGRPYSLGVLVPKNDPNYSGAFDCAEFVAYVNFQVFGKLFGCDSNATFHAGIADAFTGYFKRDADNYAARITVEQAAKTPGAMLLRVPQPNAIGHIVFSQGNGKTVEANCTKYGCIESVVNGRRWDFGILLPGVEYIVNQDEIVPEPKQPAKVFRLTQPPMQDKFIGKIQKALGGLKADNIYGVKTYAAVLAYQKEKGLIVDGEVMPGGETANELGI